VPCLLVDRRQASSQEPTDPSNGIRSRPRREVCGGTTDELGEVPHELARTRLQGITRSWIRIPLQLASYPGHLHHMGDARRCDLPGHRAI
jgi:hypothetical protein